MKFAKRTEGMKASEIRELLKLGNNKKIISFAGGLPSPDSFPVEEIKKIFETVMKKYGTDPLQYGVTEGVHELRDTLVERMRSFGIDCKRGNLVVTNGSQAVIDLVTKIFINPGDIVAVEVPTYLGGLCSFRNYQSDFLTVGIDSDGMITDELEKKLSEMCEKEREKVKLIYAIPNFHNPAGITMSLERRKHLIEISKKYSIPILEDDPYIELRYSGERLPSIKSMDKEGLVIYTSTFSKIFAPGFRLGWLVAEKTLARKITVAKQGTDLCTNTFCQYMANEYIKSGAMDRQLPKTIEIYKKKRDIMLESMKKHFPEGCDWNKPEGGMFIWVRLPEKIDTKEMFYDAIDQNVSYVHGAAFCVDGSGHNTMRLNFSNADEEKIGTGIKTLGDMIKNKLNK